MRWSRGVVLAVVMGGASAAAMAQTAVYGEFTGAAVSAAHTANLYGPTVGLYHDRGLGLIALGFDVRGSFLRAGNVSAAGSNEVLDSLQLGVRGAVTPHVLPIKPFAEALVGYAKYSAGQGVARQSGSHADYQILGGVDFTFFPRLDWRVVEFGYQRLSGLGDTDSPKTLSTGLVFRLP